MYKRLIILSLLILLAVGALTWLGYHSIRIWADGLAGSRYAEFVAVAEQIREDVKRKLDEFMQREQQRPYTDYQFYYVPENIAGGQQQQLPLLRSPLAGKLDNDLAFGNFQIDPDGTIITPYYNEEQQTANGDLIADAKAHVSNIRENLLPQIEAKFSLSQPVDSISSIKENLKESPKEDKQIITKAPEPKEVALETSKGAPQRKALYKIGSLEQGKKEAQVYEQQRDIASLNISSNTASPQQMQEAVESSERQRQIQRALRRGTETDTEGSSIAQKVAEVQMEEVQTEQTQVSYDESGKDERTDTQREKEQRDSGGQAGFDYKPEQADTSGVISLEDNEQNLQLRGISGSADRFVVGGSLEDNVQIRVEPFAPVLVRPASADSLFAGQVFLLRHVQIEDKHFVQGFQLNEKRLLDEIADSAKRFIRRGMDFSLGKTERNDAVHSALLDFGFGTVVLNLIETNPGWVKRQITTLRNWYFAIVGIALLGMLIVIASLWRNMRAQVKLAQKKDDFISAVSHELRTPLTSIRMYSEMLEKNWVKTPDKTQQYYKSMRQESERLSRLIENVLDFSRIQKGRKKYAFSLGDLNECVGSVVNMMNSYVVKAGFTVKTDLQKLNPIVFDKDAVTQIVVNLLDNAIKYAGDGRDKTIIIRTSQKDGFVVIEVEDHGPGVPHKQRKKVFDVFYRCEAESTRQTRGTGLGLALVKRFAEAHKGFVEILSAKPHGSIFRVTLSTQLLVN